MYKDHGETRRECWRDSNDNKHRMKKEKRKGKKDRVERDREEREQKKPLCMPDSKSR